MNTENKITPASVGFSLVVCSGPRGAVRDNDWPCIEWTVQLMHRGKPVWTGEWRAGVGHVDPKKALPGYGSSMTHGILESVLDAWRRGKSLRKTPEVMKAQADLAALFAKVKKVSPSLDSVMGSLLLDGSAFFDGCQFEDWASEYGYSADSIKAKETFEACDKIGRAISRAVSRDELTGLREWASEQ